MADNNNSKDIKTEQDMPEGNVVDIIVVDHLLIVDRDTKKVILNRRG